MNFSHCLDIDECAVGAHDCDLQTSTCTNVVGSFICTCKSGYVESTNPDEQTLCIGKRNYECFGLMLCMYINWHFEHMHPNIVQSMHFCTCITSARHMPVH